MSLKKLIIILITLFSIFHLSAQIKEDEYIEEIVYLDEDNDYCIEKVIYHFGWYDDWYNDVSPGSCIGSTMINLDGSVYSYRKYFNFEFSEPNIDWEIDSVILNVKQTESIGNDIFGEFPQFFNYPNSFLKVALLDFDMQYLSETFNSSEATEIGILSNNATIEWKQLDVTQAYLNAQNSLGYSHFSLMLYFDYIWDYHDMDCIGVANATSSNPPFLSIYYRNVTHNTSEDIEQNHNLIHCYPNPTSEMLTIKNESKKAISAINIYNLKGQKVFSNQNVSTKNGEVNLALPTNIASGIYFVQCKIDGNQQTITKKIFVK